MLRTLLLFTCLFFCWAAQAQVKITGTVSDTAGNTLEGVSVVVLSPHDNLTLAFSLTRIDGAFSVELETELDSLVVVAQALGHGKQQLVIPNESRRVTFTLPSQSLELKEVTVKASPITSSNDTISYMVAAFTDIKDRSIADVLRRMPGIEVEGSGRILYEGKPIQKFYIEGLDLLEGRYNLASNNLPAGAVTSVQVLENHQPVRILDSLATSYSTSLNIKLKNSVTTTGVAQLGMGIPLALWDINLTPMLFTKKHQMLTSYQANNSGRDVSADLTTLTAEELKEQAEQESPQQDILRIRELSPPRFSGERHLFNNIHLVSANYLRKINEELQLRVNASYLNDRQLQSGETRSIFFLPEDTITLREYKNNRLYFNTAETGITLHRNTPKKFLENRLRLKGNWGSKWGGIMSSEAPVLQNLENPSYTASNRLQVIQPLGKQLVELTSVINFSNLQQQLNVVPGRFKELMPGGQPVDELEQQLMRSTFYTYNAASMTKSLGSWSVNPQMGFQIEHQELESNLIGIMYGDVRKTENVASNNLNWQRSKYFIGSEAEYKANHWSISARLPMNYRVYEFTDRPVDDQTTLNRLTVEPGIAARFNLTPLLKATASLRLSNHFGTIDQLTSAYVLRDYRTLQANDAPLLERFSQNYLLGLAYRNALKSLFANLSYNYSLTESNVLYQHLLDEKGILVISGTEQHNPVQNHSIAWQGSKYLSELKTTMKLGGNFYISTRKQRLGDNIVDSQHRYYSLRAEVNTKPFEWLGVQYASSLAILDGDVGQKGMGVTQQQEHALDLSVYPIPSHYLGLKLDAYLNSSTDNAPRNYYFADAVYRFTFGKSKIDAELRWANIFNASEFLHIYTDGFTRIENTYKLRPSQLMLAFKFTL